MSIRGAMALAVLALAGCGGPTMSVDVARYDLGAGGPGPVTALPLASVEVQAASWLAGPEMHYRLAYAEPLRRLAYQESRWAAPPAELVSTLLARRLGGGHGSGCRIYATLDEFEQRFDDARASRVALELRATLASARGGDALAQRVFRIDRPAASPDARGGAAAARDAALALADELAAWSGDLARNKAELAARCRN